MDRVEQRASELGLEFQRFDGGAPLWIDADSACIREFARITASQPRTVCYGTDGGELTELENRVVFGPGDIAQAHTTDEWIELDQLQRGTQLLHQAARHFLTRQ
jgi:acetylornithine deacetylase